MKLYGDTVFIPNSQDVRLRNGCISDWLLNAAKVNVEAKEGRLSRFSGLSGLFGLSGSSGWVSGQANKTNQRNEVNETNQINQSASQDGCGSVGLVTSDWD